MSLDILKQKLNALAGFTGSSTPASIKPAPKKKIDLSFIKNMPDGPQSKLPTSSPLTQKLNSLPGSTISKAPAPTRFERFKALFPQEMREDIFGTGTMVREGDPIIPGIKAPRQRFDTGALGFLYGGLTKSDMQRYEERRQKLIDNGLSPERAEKVAEASLSGAPLNLNAKEERVIRNAKLWDITEAALDSLDFIPGLGAVIGQTGDVTKKIIKGFAKTEDVVSIEKSLVNDFNMLADDAKRIAPEIAESKSPVVIASKIDETIRGPREAREQAGKLTEDLKTRLSSLSTPAQPAPKLDLKGGYFRSMQGGSRFEEIPESAVAPAPIREGLDTFVTKSDDGFVVIEGRTGQQLGTPGKTMQEALQSAKQAVETLGTRMDEFVSSSKISPRYTQVEEKNWRIGYANERDTFKKEDILRAIANMKSTDEELSSVLTRIEDLGDNASSNSWGVAWDVAQNPAASRQTKSRALKLRERLMEPESARSSEVLKKAEKNAETLRETTLFHGTNAGDSIRKNGFSISKEAQEGSPFLGDNSFEGVHLSTSRAPYEEGGQLEDVMDVLEVSISAKRILKTDPRGIKDLYRKYGVNELSSDASTKLTKKLEEEGFDGIQYGDEIVVFDPKNVKLTRKADDAPVKAPVGKKGWTDVSDKGAIPGEEGYAIYGDPENPLARIIDVEGEDGVVVVRQDGTYVLNPKTKGAVGGGNGLFNDIDEAKRAFEDEIKGTVPKKTPPKVKGVTTADKLTKKTIAEQPPVRQNMKLSAMSRSSSSYENFLERTGITEEALDATVRKQGFKDAREYYAKNGPEKIAPSEARSFDEGTPERLRSKEEALSEEASYAKMADEYEGSDFVIRSKARASEQITDNLRSVFADMRQIDLNDPKLKFTDEDLYQAHMQYEFAKESLLDHPGRPLARYVSKKEGQFLDLKDPAKAKTQAERARIEDRNRKVLQTAEKALEGTKYSETYDDPDTIREVIEDFWKKREALKNITEDLQKIRDGIRTAKALDNFVGENQAKLARELARNQKALANLAKASERAGFQRGFKAGAKKYEALVSRLRERRQRINGLKWMYDLSDAEFAKIRLSPDTDPRFMEKADFETYMTELEKRAKDAQARRIERTIIQAIIKEKNLKNTENLREVMGFPALGDMSIDQLKRYDSMLSKLEESDVVLSKRTLEVIDRTVLKGAKTVRQVRNFLAQELKRTLGMDVNLSDLENLTANRLDGYLWDSALAEKQPFYAFLVHRTHKHMLEGEANFLRIQKRFEDLVRAANKSRRKTFIQKIKQQFVPTKPEIRRYLEARGEERELFAKGLTKEELDLAEYMRSYYNNAYNYLSYINEIRGARYLDAYFTHVRKGFLEKWTDDGFVAALKNIWDQNKEDLAIANIIDKDTGQILPKSKFFQYTLRRTGEGEVSQNVTRVFLKYAKLLERKKMLDKMVAELDVYTRSLTPQEMTPRGLQMNRKMHEFVNEFLNNKRGRREPFLRIEQNSIPDMLIRGGNMLVSMLDLGLNFLSGSAAMVGEQMANYALLGAKGTLMGYKRRLWDTGMRRFLEPNAAKILKEAEPFLGRNIWTELAEADMPVFERVTKAMFGLFSQSSVEANKIYLLANLTPEELKAGKISAERLAAMRLDAGRWRDMGRDVKSIVGATSPGAAFTKYKGWAIPIMRTTAKNYKDLAVMLAKKDFKGAVKSREIKEIIRQAETIGVALYLASVIAGHDEDEGPIAKLKARVIQESMTLLGGLDPRFFLASPRIISWLTQLSNNLIMLAKLEEYKTDSKYGDKGDLKGWGGLKRQFTPGFVRQFLPNEPEKTVPAGTGTKGMPGNPALQNLNRLQNLQRNNVLPTENPAIQNLRKLQERMRNSVRP